MQEPLHLATDAPSRAGRSRIRREPADDLAALAAIRAALVRRHGEDRAAGRWRDAEGAEHWLVAPDWDALAATRPAVAIGFFGQARDDVDHAPIVDLEHDILRARRVVRRPAGVLQRALRQRPVGQPRAVRRRRRAGPRVRRRGARRRHRAHAAPLPLAAPAPRRRWPAACSAGTACGWSGRPTTTSRAIPSGAPCGWRRERNPARRPAARRRRPHGGRPRPRHRLVPALARPARAPPRGRDGGAGRRHRDRRRAARGSGRRARRAATRALPLRAALSRPAGAGPRDAPPRRRRARRCRARRTTARTRRSTCPTPTATASSSPPTAPASAWPAGLGYTRRPGAAGRRGPARHGRGRGDAGRGRRGPAHGPPPPARGRPRRALRLLPGRARLRGAGEPRLGGVRVGRRLPPSPRRQHLAGRRRRPAAGAHGRAAALDASSCRRRRTSRRCARARRRGGPAGGGARGRLRRPGPVADGRRVVAAAEEAA